MPFSTIKNRRDVSFDKDLEIRDRAAAAIAATTNSTALMLNAPFAVYPITQHVTCYAAYTSADIAANYWTVKLQVSADGASWFDGTTAMKLAKTGGTVYQAIAGLEADETIANAQYARAVYTKTGTPGNLSIGSFLA